MNYKILRVNEDGLTIYGLIDGDGVIRTNLVAEDPQFQKWVAEGNEPLPADEGVN